MQRQPVGQAPARLVDKACQHASFVANCFLSRHQRIRQAMQHAQLLLVTAFKVPLKTLRKTVDIALVGVVNPKALNGGHHYHGAQAPVRRGDVGQILQHAHPHATAVAGLQRLTVRVASGLQGFQCLAANRVTRHQPHHHWRIASPPVLRQHANRMRRHQRFAAARRDAQANARHSAKRVWVVRPPYAFSKSQRRAF